MKNEKQVEYKDIGKVLYRRSQRARNISIRINNQGDVRVTVPTLVGFRRAEGFVLEKTPWIQAKLRQIDQRTEEKLVWKSGDVLQMRTKPVEFVGGRHSEPSILELEDRYILELPDSSIDGELLDKGAVLDAVARIGLDEARSYLPKILERCSKQCGIDYSRVTVRRMTSRWGSCSSKNSISLNSALIFLDEKLIEYVCYHELAHVLHKNHSKMFWDTLISFYPSATMDRKTLRKQAIIA